VQAHLNKLKATYKRHLRNGAQETILGVHRKPKPLPQPVENTLTIKIPLSPEIMNAFRAAEQSGQMYIDVTAFNQNARRVR